MNSFVEQYRLNNPSDESSDDYITWTKGKALLDNGATLDDFPEDFAADYRRLERSFRPGLGQELGQQLGAGIDTVQGMAYGGVGFLGDVFGVEPVREFGREGYERNMEEAAQNAPTVASYKDINFDDGLLAGLSDTAYYLTGQAGRVIPSVGESVITGAVGAAVGSGVGPAGTIGGAITGFGSKAAIKGMIRQALKKSVGSKAAAEVAEEAAKAATKREMFSTAANALVAKGVKKEVAEKAARQLMQNAARASMATRTVLADSIIQNTGATWGELSQEDVGRFDRVSNALLGGSLSGALDSLVPATVLSRLMGNRPNKTSAALARKVFGRKEAMQDFFRAALKDVGMEGVTESLQELIQEVAVQRGIHGGDINAAIDAIDTEEMREKMINAAIAGAMGGGVLGVPAAGVTTIQDYRQVNKKTPKAVKDEDIENFRSIAEDALDVIHGQEEDVDTGINKPPPRKPVPENEDDFFEERPATDRDVRNDEPLAPPTATTEPKRAKREQRKEASQNKDPLERHRRDARMSALAAYERGRLHSNRMAKAVASVRERYGDDAANAYQEAFETVADELGWQTDPKDLRDQNRNLQTKPWESEEELSPEEEAEKAQLIQLFQDNNYETDELQNYTLEVIRWNAREEGLIPNEETTESKSPEVPKQQASQESEAPPAVEVPESHPLAKTISVPPAVEVPAEPSLADLSLSTQASESNEVATQEIPDLAALNNGKAEVFTTEELEVDNEGDLLREVNNRASGKEDNRAEMEVEMMEAFNLLNRTEDDLTAQEKAIKFVIQKGSSVWNGPYLRKILGKDGLHSSEEVDSLMARLEEIKDRYVGKKIKTTHTKNAIAMRSPDGKVYVLGVYSNKDKAKTVRVKDPLNPEGKYIILGTETDGRSEEWMDWSIVGYAHFTRSPSNSHHYVFPNLESFRRFALTSENYTTPKVRQSKVRTINKAELGEMLKEELSQFFDARDVPGVVRQALDQKTRKKVFQSIRDNLTGPLAKAPGREDPLTVTEANGVISIIKMEAEKIGQTETVSLDGLTEAGAGAQGASTAATPVDGALAVSDSGGDIDENAILNYAQGILNDLQIFVKNELQEDIDEGFELTVDDVEMSVKGWEVDNKKDFLKVIGTIGLRVKGEPITLENAKENIDDTVRKIAEIIHASILKGDIDKFQEEVAGFLGDGNNGERRSTAQSDRKDDADSEGPGSQTQAQETLELVKPEQPALPDNVKPAYGDNKDGPEPGDPPMATSATPEGVKHNVERAASIDEAKKSGDPERMKDAGISPAGRIALKFTEAFPGLSDQGTLFVHRFFDLLGQRNPDVLDTLTIAIQKDIPEEFRQAADQNDQGAYSASSNTIWINPANHEGDEIIHTLLHESGHFVVNMLADFEALQTQWMELSDRQREAAWKEYSGQTVQGYKLKEIYANPTAAIAFQEWTAMTFHKVAMDAMSDPELARKNAKRSGMADAIIEEIIAFVQNLYEVFSDFVGSEAKSEEVERIFMDLLAAPERQQPKANEPIALPPGVQRVEGEFVLTTDENFVYQKGQEPIGSSVILLDEPVYKHGDLLFTEKDKDRVLVVQNDQHSAFGKTVLAEGKPVRRGPFDFQPVLGTDVRISVPVDFLAPVWPETSPEPDPQIFRLSAYNGDDDSKIEVDHIFLAPKVLDKSPNLEFEGGSNAISQDAKNVRKNVQDSLRAQQRKFVARGSDRASTQERSIKALQEWATETGRIIKSLHRHQRLDEGFEHEVYIDRASGRVIKATRIVEPGAFGAHGNARDYIENIANANHAFGDDIRLEGIMETPQGIRIVTSQPYIREESLPTEDDVQEWFEENGFVRQADGGMVNDDYEIWDATPDNFIKTSSGLVPIDLQVNRIDKRSFLEVIQDNPSIFLAPRRSFEKKILQGQSRYSGYENPKPYLDHARMAWDQVSESLTNVWEQVTTLLNEEIGNVPYSEAQFARFVGNPARMQEFIVQQAGNHGVDLDENAYSDLGDTQKAVVASIISEIMMTVRDSLGKQYDRAEKSRAVTNERLRALRDRDPQSLSDRDRRVMGLLAHHSSRWDDKVRLLGEARNRLYHELKQYASDMGAHPMVKIASGGHIAVPRNDSDEMPEAQPFTWENGEQVLGINEATILRRQWDWLHNPENKGRNPYLWNTIKAQYVSLAKMSQQKGMTKSQNILFGWFRPLAQQLKELDHPAATDAARQQFMFDTILETHKNEATRLGQRSDEYRMEAMEALGLTSERQYWDTFSRLFDTPLKRHMEQHGATVDGAIRALRSRPESSQYLMDESGDVWNARAVAALRKYVESEMEASRFFRGLMNNYSSVTDSRIMMPDESHHDFDPNNPWDSAPLVPMERPPLDLGTGTFMVTPNLDTVRGFIENIAPKNPTTGRRSVSVQFQTATSENMDSVIDMAGEVLSSPQMVNGFLNALIYTEKSPFFVDSDGEFLSKDEILAAWLLAEDDPATFLRALSGGSPARLNENLKAIREAMDMAVMMMNEVEGKADGGIQSVPHIAIDARLRDRVPTDWVRFREFGATANIHLLGNLAFQASFGKRGVLFKERLAATKDYYHEVRTAFMQASQDREVRVATGARRKQAMLEAIDPKHREVLRRAFAGKKMSWLPFKTSNPTEWVNERLNRLDKIEAGFNGTFASELGPIKEATTFLQFIQLLAQGALNGPRSAFVQFNSLYFPSLLYGRSGTAWSQIKDSVKYTMLGILGSGMNVLGIEMQYSQDTMALFDRLVRIKGETPDKGMGLIKGYKQLRADLGPRGGLGDDKVRRGLRTVSGLLQRGINRTAADERAFFPSFNPFAPFRTAITGIKDGTIMATWKSFDALAAKAIQYVENHSDLPSSDPASPFHPRFKFTPEMLGYTDKMGGLRQDSFAFHAMTRALNEEVGTTLEQVAIGNATGRVEGDGPFTDLQYALLAQTALSYITSESTHFTSRPTWTKDSYMGRIASPLLGWTTQQPNNFSKMFKDPRDSQVTAKTIGNGFVTFAMMALPFTLGFALFMDWFDEGILGKKSGMRKLSLNSSLGENVKAVSERFSRWGPMGLPAEVGNLLMNVGAGGGDIRDLSLDQRILFANSMRGVLSALGTWSSQRSFTYASVGRPLMMSLGMNGPMQIGQMISNITGLSNMESRVNRRTNANNWLRSAGRINGLEVRSYGGGGYTPTPMTPHVTNMILAAMANDRERFRKSYRKAIKAAEDMGKDDPIKAVKLSFQSRHPLKSIFKTPPTKSEYAALLSTMRSSMPLSNGEKDVQDAIRLFNAYGQSLGITPYTGKESTSSSTPMLYPQRITRSNQSNPFAVTDSSFNPFMP